MGKEMGRRSLDFKSPRKSSVSQELSSPTAKKLAVTSYPTSSHQTRQRRSSTKEINVLIADSPLRALEASESEFTTPESRQRTRVARFGIDDVKLSEVISPRAKSKLSMPAGV